MRCSKCGNDNREGRKFCAKCAAPLSRSCPQCGALNEPGEDFCGECGTALLPPQSVSVSKSDGSPIVTAEPTTAQDLDGERKTVTALFADIKGSMELMQDLDPEEARAIVDPALKLMIDAVHRYDGYIVQSTGDGVLALFGAPVAHEDHPQRALYAALRMQEDMRRFAERLRAEKGMNLQVRVGANVGDVVVRSIQTGEKQVEYTPIGHSISLASRLQTLANPGSIAISDGLRKLVEGYFALKALGPARIRGSSEPVNVYEVTGLGPLRTRLQRAAGRGLTKFVGREREMDALKHAAELARQGRGQIVAAMAEPGVGKSRLYFEFKAIEGWDSLSRLSLTGSKAGPTVPTNWMVLETVSISHGKASAYLPVLDLLQGYFKIASGDDERTRREKVNGKVVTLDRTLEDTLPYLFSLLGIVEGDDPLAQMDGQLRKRRTLEAIKRILLRESLNQPLMVIFEDLHWIDEATQEFLNLLADSLGTAKLLLLVNYRPEYSHKWNSKTYYTQLRLDPLGRESAEEMLTALLTSPAPATSSAGASRERARPERAASAARGEVEGSGSDINVADRVRVLDDLAPLRRLIIDKTEGNPFFMEEMVQVLFDEGALVREGAAVKLTKPANALKIPPTVQGILAARIDRLPADAKELLQTLSVIGREFPLSLIGAMVTKSDDELNRLLNDLQLGEFIYEQPASGSIEYIFKHALTQEAAYNSVLIQRRKHLHERIGAALETLYRSSLDDHLAELAHHYARSSNSAKAVEYCRRACEQSADRGSYAEAVMQFETALARLQELPDDDRRAELELDLRNTVHWALLMLKGWGAREGELSAARAIELARRPGVPWEKSWRALRGVWLTASFRASVSRANELATQMLAIAEQHENTDLTAASLELLGYSQIHAGKFGRAAECIDRAISLIETIPKATGGLTSGRHIIAYGISAWNTWFLGFPNRAANQMNQLFALARGLNSKLIESNLHTYASFFFFLLRERERMREHAGALVTLATKLSSLSSRAQAEIYLGWLDSVEHDRPEVIERMQRALAEYRATGTLTIVPLFLSLIALAQGRFDQYDEALVAISEALTLIEETGEHAFQVEAHRIKGELLLAQDLSRSEQAEESFRTAVDIAIKQNAKSLELRATTSLARLLRDTNHRNEARTMLAEIYNWFTEGFDTADLKDARALLDELERI